MHADARHRGGWLHRNDMSSSYNTLLELSREIVGDALLPLVREKLVATMALAVTV